MQDVHHLNCQHNHHAPAGIALRSNNTELQILTPVDHILENMIDCVLMDACSFGDDLSHLSPHATNETGSTWFCPVSRIVGKYSQQIAIVNGRPLKIVMFAFPPVVLAQCDPHGGKWFDLGSHSISWSCARELL